MIFLSLEYKYINNEAVKVFDNAFGLTKPNEYLSVLRCIIAILSIKPNTLNNIVNEIIVKLIIANFFAQYLTSKFFG